MSSSDKYLSKISIVLNVVSRCGFNNREEVNKIYNIKKAKDKDRNLILVVIKILIFSFLEIGMIGSGLNKVSKASLILSAITLIIYPLIHPIIKEIKNKRIKLDARILILYLILSFGMMGMSWINCSNILQYLASIAVFTLVNELEDYAYYKERGFIQ